MKPAALGWLGIIRLGLVQTALGSIVVLTTSTMNRVMVIELALPAMLPGALVALHYLIQVLRPRMGHGSDVGGRRTAWIVAGMAVLALGGVAAAAATVLMSRHMVAGIVLAVAAFAAIGVGVGASGTSLLALLAKQVEERKRAAAATIVWVMMIAGFVVTASVTGYLLDPFSPMRLLQVTAAVASLAMLVTVLALRGIEKTQEAAAARTVTLGVHDHTGRPARSDFKQALCEVWAEPAARRFTIFVFVSMLAYSAQDLILEPFAGAVFGFTPGESTRLAGVQHGGVLLGMAGVGLAGTLIGSARFSSLRLWCMGGCLASALALCALAWAGFIGPGWPLKPTVFALGAANGVFAVSAIGAMMGLAGENQEGRDGRQAREGLRMGLWGAAQAIAFGLGGFAGTAASDLARWLMGPTGGAYSSVFLGEAVLFVVSALLALRAVPAASMRRRASAATSPILSAQAGSEA
jgi:BCD family chlorophyll transporter-like MFS transporter